MPELVPIRYGRMSASRFAFCRGAACVMASAMREYRQAIRRFASMNVLDVWYARASVAELQELLRTQATGRQIKRLDREVAKGRRKDSARAFEKLPVKRDGSARIRADAPLIVPIDDLLDDVQTQRLKRAARNLVDSYRRSLSGDRRRLPERYRYARLARSSAWAAWERAAG